MGWPDGSGGWPDLIGGWPDGSGGWPNIGAPVGGGTPTVLSVSSASFAEGTDIGLTVTLSNATIADTVFTYDIAGANGLGNADITGTTSAVTFSNGVTKTTGTTSGTLTVPAGVTSFTATWGTVDDALHELNERISFTVAGINGQGTITDNDTAPTLSINSVSQNEETATMTFTVTQSAASGRQTSFSYATSDGTAIAGNDYTSTSGTGTISIGSTTTTIVVPITNDSAVESDETFYVTLSSPVGATLSGTFVGTGTIVNTDTATTNLSGSSYSATTTLTGLVI